MITVLLDEGYNLIEIVGMVFSLGVVSMIGTAMSSYVPVADPFALTADFFDQAGTELSSMFF